MRLPLTLTGRRAAFGWAWAASSSPQLQNAIPLAAAPFKKFRRVVIGRLPQLFPQAGRLTRRSFFILSATTLPIWTRKGNHSGKIAAQRERFRMRLLYSLIPAL